MDRAARESGPRADVGDRRLAEAAASRRRDPDERRGQLLRLGAPLLSAPALPHATWPDLRSDGLWRTGGRRREDRGPEPDGARLLRRRRLPDERPGDRDR